MKNKTGLIVLGLIVGLGIYSGIMLYLGRPCTEWTQVGTELICVR